MPIIPPRFIPPQSPYLTPYMISTTAFALGVTTQEAAAALEVAFTPSWYAIWLDDGLTSERYGTSAYSTPEEAQSVCDALQEAYQCLYYECRFVPSLRGKKPNTEVVPFDHRLISIIGEDDPFALDKGLLGEQ